MSALVLRVGSILAWLALTGCVESAGLCQAGGPISLRHGVVALGAGALVLLGAWARRRRTKK